MGRQMVMRTRRQVGFYLEEDIFMQCAHLVQEMGFKSFTELANRALVEFVRKHSHHISTADLNPTSTTHPQKIRFTDPDESIEMLADKDEVVKAAAEKVEVELTPSGKDIIELLKKSQG